jgi:alpha-D-ribose 1-methylphosphonate 5-triphosphate synthase subunit PhnG
VTSHRTRTDAERRFASLCMAEPGELAAVAERVLHQDAAVEVVMGPRAATMLVELTESVRGQPFHPGEVVVSEAAVTVDGHRGDGLVLGADPERALAAAICDAAAEAGVLAQAVEQLVARTESADAERRRRAAAVADDTRVNVEVIG